MARRVREAAPWDWLKGGVALGLLSAFAFLSYKPLGVSTSYPRAVALALNAIMPDWVAANAYFQRVAPVVDWQLLLVAGIVVGGWIAGRRTASVAPSTSVRGSSRLEGAVRSATPSAASCPVTPGDRVRSPLYLFSGGFLLLFGARLAGGCTSGHVITGFSQLAVASFLFAAAVFGAGIPLARYIAGKEAA